MKDFYPRPPRGGRLVMRIIAAWSMLFLSTPSARRATVTRLTKEQLRTYFYPRPPRGGRLAGLAGCHGRSQISIHALREEGDNQPDFIADFYFIFLSTPSARRATWSVRTTARPIIFLSTPSARRATVQIDRDEVARVISIHALREEGDAWAMWSSQQRNDFYPRPPRGGRPDRERP